MAKSDPIGDGGDFVVVSRFASRVDRDERFVKWPTDKQQQ